MKKMVIGVSPLVLLIWLLIALDQGFVRATLGIVVGVVFVALVIAWLVFVEKLFNDD